jgi:glycosyltransferase involved in cell wall biosynthesis
MSSSHLLYDQDPPFPETYGGISVEASIFKLPIISRISPYAQEFWKRETGLDCPVIQWSSDDDLFRKVYMLAKDAKLRREFGEKCYSFMRAIHDEKPVAERFMKFVEEMN